MAAPRTPDKVQAPDQRDPDKVQHPAQSPRRLRTAVTVDSLWEVGRSTSPLHDQLVRCTKSLRQVYGDATTFEALAAGIRFLDLVDMQSKEFRGFKTAVKVAAVAGIAAKKVHSTENVAANHVIMLWAKIAGKSSEPQVRALERLLLVHWVRQV